MRADRAVRWLITVVLGSAPVWACGPFLPERMLVDRSAALLGAPRGRLVDEIDAIRPGVPAGLAPHWSADDPGITTDTVDVAELKAAVAGRPDAVALGGLYAAARVKLRALVSQPARGAGASALAPLAPPDGTPAEFADYLRGAIAQAQGDQAAARASWQGLLARPEADRRRRSVWAAFMLGKSLLTEDPAQANRWFALTRELSRNGFSDRLGLGAASLGWEAQIALDRGQFPQAAALYLQAHAAGDPAAAASLRFLCWRLFKADGAARAAALKDRGVRRVIAAHLASLPDLESLAKGSVEAQILAEMLEQTRGEHDVDGADRLAWIAYQRGDMTAAAAWLDRSASGPVASWVRSKLLARGGKIGDATRELAAAVQGFPLATPAPPEMFDEESGPHDMARRLRGELAILELARRHYTEAFGQLLRAGYWRDAAFVGERVLTVGELQAEIDARFPDAPARAPDSKEALSTAELARYLLARRLARLGRWSEAAKFYPSTEREALKELLAAQAEFRQAKTDEERSMALWKQALVERESGMELLGTEVGPDWRVDSGQYDEDQLITPPAKGEKLSLVTAAERRRVKASAPGPVKRFHYRYVAADHAFEAARLLPASSIQARQMLCKAFSWLSARDPKAAARYAREVIRRGQESCP
jgi:hypothetical protein